MPETSTSSGGTVEEFDARLKAALESHSRSVYPSIETQLQRRAAEAFAELSELALTLKASAVSEGDEDAAARLLMAECLCEGLEERSRFWLALLEGDARRAWAKLIGAQSAIGSATRAHPAGVQFAALLAELEFLEKVVFPPQAFFSTGILILASHCSICEQPFGICEHIKGRVYGGELASRVITKAMPQEVSAVEAPDDKLCRVVEIQENGLARDTLTGARCSGGDGASLDKGDSPESD